MSSPIRRYQVFISSTKKDLESAREEVTWECLKLGFIPVGMEGFSATSDRGWRTITKTIDRSDYYVVIVGGMYGSIDEETKLSWTEKEYEYALSKNLEVLAFIRDWASLVGDEIDAKQKRVKAFRARLEKAHHRETWTNVDDLRACMGAALSKRVRENEDEGTAPPGWYRGPALDIAEFIQLSAENRELRERLARAGFTERRAELLKKIPIGKTVLLCWKSSRTMAASKSHNLGTRGPWSGSFSWGSTRNVTSSR